MINEVKFGFNEALTRGQGIANVVNGIDTSGIAINFGSAAPNTGIPGQGTSTGSAVAGGLVRLNSQANRPRRALYALEPFLYRQPFLEPWESTT